MIDFTLSIVMYELNWYGQITDIYLSTMIIDRFPTAASCNDRVNISNATRITYAIGVSNLTKLLKKLATVCNTIQTPVVKSDKTKLKIIIFDADRNKHSYLQNITTTNELNNNMKKASVILAML